MNRIFNIEIRCAETLDHTRFIVFGDRSTFGESNFILARKWYDKGLLDAPSAIFMRGLCGPPDITREEKQTTAPDKPDASDVQKLAENVANYTNELADAVGRLAAFFEHRRWETPPERKL